MSLTKDPGAIPGMVPGVKSDHFECFAVRCVPTFAMFGKHSGVRIAGAGPDKLPALRIAVEWFPHRGGRGFF